MLLYWDAYYSEQAFDFESGRTQNGRTTRTDTPIPVRWVTIVLGAYFAVAIAVASLATAIQGLN
jgi:hypothetical protein